MGPFLRWMEQSHNRTALFGIHSRGRHVLGPIQNTETGRQLIAHERNVEGPPTSFRLGIDASLTNETIPNTPAPVPSHRLRRYPVRTWARRHAKRGAGPNQRRCLVREIDDGREHSPTPNQLGLRPEFRVDFIQVDLTHRHLVCGVFEIVFEQLKILFVDLID